MDLELSSNNLSGPVPPELGNLTNLMELELEHNELTGPVPQSFLALEMLTWFFFEGNAGLCAPNTTEFVTWLQSIDETSGPFCSASSSSPNRRSRRGPGACERTIRSYLITSSQDAELACCRDIRLGGAGFAPSVADPERGAVLGPACTPVIEAGGADVGVAEPVLDACDVGVVLEGVGGGGGP